MDDSYAGRRFIMGWLSYLNPFHAAKSAGKAVERHVIRPIVHNPGAFLTGGIVGANIAEHQRKAQKTAFQQQEQHHQQLQSHYAGIEGQMASEKKRIESLQASSTKKHQESASKYGRSRVKGGLFGKDFDEDKQVRLGG